MRTSLPVAVSKVTESPATAAVCPRLTVVVPFTTNVAPAGAALSVSVTRTAPVSCCGLKRTGMLRVKASSAKRVTGWMARTRERRPRATVARFMTALLCWTVSFTSNVDQAERAGGGGHRRGARGLRLLRRRRVVHLSAHPVGPVVLRQPFGGILSRTSVHGARAGQGAAGQRPSVRSEGARRDRLSVGCELSQR